MAKQNMSGNTLSIKFYLVITFLFLTQVIPASNFTTASYGVKYDGDADSAENEVTTKSEELLSMESTNNVLNLSLVLKMDTPCETPNLDPGYCTEIKKCAILYHQLANVNARQFLRQSMCGPENEDLKNPRVCCGKFNNFRNVSKIDKSLFEQTIDDDKIFPKKCGNQKIMMRGRILGGKQAMLGEFPWMARLIHKNKLGYKTIGCAGFLIHSKYVVSAGHCVHSNFTLIRGPLFSVVLGEHNSETHIDCSPGGTFCADPVQISRVSNIIIHPEYDPNCDAHYNDIALIYLKKGARMTEYVKPICLLREPYQIPNKYTISGWGKTENDQISKIKMKVDLPAYDKAECNDKYSVLNINLKETQICVGGQKNKDSCNGDSGGPLMVTFNGTTWYAAGVVSYGVGCGYDGWPGVYTNLPYYISWIKYQIMLNSVNNRSAKVRGNRRKQEHARNNTNTSHTKGSQSLLV